MSSRAVPDYRFASGASPDERRSAEALRASEASYRAVFEASSDAIYVLDRDTGAILDVNPAACALNGYPPEEMKRLGIGGLSADRPPYDWESARRLIALAAGGEPQRLEWLARHSSGRDVWGEVTLQRVTILGEDRVLATARDITDRKAAEEARQRAEEELLRLNEALEQRVAARTGELAAANAALEAEVAESRAARRALQQRSEELEGVFRALPDLYFRLAPDGTVLEHRSGGDERLALPPEQFLGKSLPELLSSLMPSDVAVRVRQAFDEVGRTGKLVCVEYPLRVNGCDCEFEARLFPLGGGSLIAVVREITDRRRAERELRQREEHFRRLIETSHDLIQTLNAEGKIVYTGPSVQRLLGYTPEEITGGGAAEYIHPDDHEAVQAAMMHALTNPGAIIHLEYRVLHRDGRWRWFEAMGRTLSEHSAEQGLVANARDITERRHAEEALARAKEEAERAREVAERANRAKSEFLSRMSHELRTPLNSILGFAQLMERAPLQPEQKKGVAHILRAGRHLLQLINEVLELARIETGRHSLSLEPVRLGTVLQEAVGLVRPLAAQWRVELDEGPWPCCDAYVQADRQRLTQVLLNLLGNAIKYNRPGGRVRVSCEPMARESESPRMVVRVRDTGRGIPSDRLDQLFTPFARLGAEKSDVEGTGLGLALSQRLTEAMGGSLTLDSTGAEGSVFRVELPGASDPLRRLEEPSGPPAALEGVPHAPATILYIEDNLANLSLVETILLSRPAWRTLPALQGQIGVELAREHTPDLILLDLHLPDITGEEVLRRLRAEPRTAAIPIVVITADATRGTADRLRTAGADDYLTKPLEIDEFLSTLERFLRVGPTPPPNPS
jgi:PAS domain S-box-containing protein